ncbi:hypothetical protein EV424DRAFT_1351816 [Suillus variegatus]|nr:hypothetical protein EV424DRAFT_1351816 [Suillus variegatus]
MTISSSIHVSSTTIEVDRSRITSLKASQDHIFVKDELVKYVSHVSSCAVMVMTLHICTIIYSIFCTIMGIILVLSVVFEFNDSSLLVMLYHLYYLLILHLYGHHTGTISGLHYTGAIYDSHTRLEQICRKQHTCGKVKKASSTSSVHFMLTITRRRV